MEKEQSRLVERLRSLLADERTTREISMFGGRSFMVNEKMLVSALGNGDLLVRVSRERDGGLMELPEASRLKMGGRAMGPGWISVSADSITSDERLSYWIDVAFEHNRGAGT